MQCPKLSKTIDDNSPPASCTAPSGTRKSSQQEENFSLFLYFLNQDVWYYNARSFSNTQPTCDFHPGINHSEATVTAGMTCPHLQKAGWLQLRYIACPAEHSQGPRPYPQGGKEAKGKRKVGEKDLMRLHRFIQKASLLSVPGQSPFPLIGEKQIS